MYLNLIQVPITPINIIPQHINPKRMIDPSRMNDEAITSIQIGRFNLIRPRIRPIYPIVSVVHSDPVGPLEIVEDYGDRYRAVHPGLHDARSLTPICPVELPNNK